MADATRPRIYVELTDPHRADDLEKSVQALDRGLRINRAFAGSRPNEKAQRRPKLRGSKHPLDLSRFRVIEADDPDVDLEELCRRLVSRPEVRSATIEEFPRPLYNPTDPNGLDSALTDQQLTHPTDLSALDENKGAGTLIGLIEMPFHNAGADYSRPELGGTGDRAADWAAIQAGTHAKFVAYTDTGGTAIDPFGTGHGDRTVPRCVAVADNNIDYLGTAPEAKLMFAYQDAISAAIVRLTDLGVDVISISYTGSSGRRVATQYAVSNGVVVVDAHANNTNAETEFPLPYEAINVGGYRQNDYSTARSWGIGLTVLATSTSGTTFESYATPTVAGAAALLLAKYPTWTPFDIHRALIQSAFKAPQMGGTVFARSHGWGLLRIHDALRLSLEDLLPLPPVDVQATLEHGRTLDLTWTNRPITNFSGTRIVARRDSPPVAADGNEIQIDVAAGSNQSYVVPPASGNWYFAVLSRDAADRFSEPVEYVHHPLGNYVYRCPKAPSLNPVVTPTTGGTVTLTGGKERLTAIHANGVEVVPLDESDTWTASVSLNPGGNLIPVNAVDEYGESSDPAYAFVDRQMYVRLEGDTMTGALQLDNAGASGGLKMRKGTNGNPEWAVRTSGEDLVFVEPDDNNREVVRFRDISGTNRAAIQLAALSGATLSADELRNLQRPPIVRWMKADDGTTTETVSLGGARRVLAFIAMNSSDPRHDHDSGDMYAADIFRVDGSRTPGTSWHGGAHLGSSGSNSNLLRPFFVGDASTIQFRLRSFQDASVWAAGVVINLA